MGTLRTLLLAIMLGGIGTAPAAWAQVAPWQDQLRTFATCVGRLSAQMEWQWMFDGPGSEETQRQRAGIIELMEALIPPEQGREVLAWRVEAKMAHAYLLTRATFGQDKRAAQRAERLAVRQIGECRSLLLS